MKNAKQEETQANPESPLTLSMMSWWRIAQRVWSKLDKNNVGIVSAGVAYYGLLAFIPAMTALVALGTMAFKREQVQEQLINFFNMLPPRANELLQDQLNRSATNPDHSLTIGAVVAIVITLWSINKSIRAVIKALNIIYSETETRSVIRVNLLSLGLVVLGLLFMVLALTSIIVVPTLVSNLGVSDSNLSSLAPLRWVLLAVLMVAALAAIYRLGPDRKDARWRWLSVGSLVATILWLSGSLLFSFYVTHFANYERIYGSLGGVVILMIWIFVSAWTVLLGAVINADLESEVADS